jgi:hypothetical protein
MSDPNVDLAARVEKLEGRVEELIKNLRDNNTDLYKIVDDSFALINSSDPRVEELRQRLWEVIGKRDPPGCVVGS